MPNNSGFSVTISAVDKLSPALGNIGKELAVLSRNLRDFDRQSSAVGGGQADRGFFGQARKFAAEGSREITRSLRELGGEAQALGRHLTAAFDPLAKVSGIGVGVGAVATLGGLAETINSVATAGAQLGRTSARIGVGTTALEQLGKAAYLAGSSSDALASGLGTLGEKLTGAALGQDAGAIGLFRQLGIAVRDANGNIVAADKALPQLANAISKIENPIVRGHLAVAAFGAAGADLLPMFKDGAAGIDKLLQEVAALTPGLGEKGVAASTALERAQRRLGLAVGGVADSLTIALAPAIEPVLTSMSKWIGANQEWLRTEIEKDVTELGKSLKAVNWGQIGSDVGEIGKGFGAMASAARDLNEVLNGPFGELLRWRGYGGIFGLGRGSLMVPKEGQQSPLIQGGEPAPGSLPSIWNSVKRGLGFPSNGTAGPLPGGGFHAPIPPGTFGPPGEWATAPAQGTRVAPNDALFNWGSLAKKGGGWQSFDSPEAGVLAVKDNLLRNYAGMSLSEIFNKWAPPHENNTQLLTDRASKMMGIAADDRPDMSDREVMRRLTTTMIAQEHGGVLPPGLPQFAIDKALGFGVNTGAGAYGVPGAVMNYGGTGALGEPGTNLRTVTTNGGHSVTLNAAAAPSALAFLNELEATGYPINSLGGYSNRNKRGGSTPSEHAFGDAFDLNADPRNVWRESVPFPAGIKEMAARHGWVWGGDWKDPNDRPHFQWGGPGTVAAATAAAVAQPVADLSDIKTANDNGGAGALSGDSRTQVDVNFLNAPEGMRSGLRRVDGPADVKLRTQFAFSGGI